MMVITYVLNIKKNIPIKDNTGWNAASTVYGQELRHLLCHWHVDQYLRDRVGIDYSYCDTLRSRKNHLRSVSDENKIPIYQALGVLLQETSIEVFTDLLDKFLGYWELAFTTYFIEHYALRPGTCITLSTK